MDAESDNDNDDANFRLPARRHTPSSSRESSPSAKRQRRSFTPLSDDGDLVVPVADNDDGETPTPENAPLIRQAVGFSWTPSASANNVSTYQASVAPPPAPYFLPGQAPPKPKPSKPRAPRKKKGEQYSDKTNKFRLTSVPSPDPTPACPAPASTRISSGTSSSSGATRSPAPSRPAMSTTSYTFSYPNRHATDNSNGAATSAAPRTSDRTRSSSRSRASAHDSFSPPSTRPSSAQPTSTPRYNTVTTDPQRTRVGHASGPSTTDKGSAQGPPRPLRMITLLIEDLRSGVPDSQLAEVRVPLRIADDPEDGFWADALEICDSLQAGPSRIDGPAKVYTMRGRFRQFFMRVDQFDQHQVQSAFVRVSKERTLNVFVEAPVPQGQLPRPPVVPSEDGRLANSSTTERETTSPPNATCCRPTYSIATREDQIERLSNSNYARVERRAVSEHRYDHSSASPSAQSRSLRHDRYADQRRLSPPIPGRMADTKEERDEAIASYIREEIENHAGWVDYMQSKAKPRRVSEVLKQFTFVEDRVRNLTGRKTPPYWDGAPSCYVEKQHVWRVLKLDDRWGEDCEETMALVGYYGKNGTRYEDPRVLDMIDDPSSPKPNTIDKFIGLLQSVDEAYTQEALSGQFMSTDMET